VREEDADETRLRRDRTLRHRGRHRIEQRQREGDTGAAEEQPARDLLVGDE
jgi:hypothetical protein